MNRSARSPDCPLRTIANQPIEANGLIPRLVENLVIYSRAPGFVLTSNKHHLEAADIAEFREHHSAEELLAARGCAKVITEDNCPYWRYDPENYFVLPRIELVN